MKLLVKDIEQRKEIAHMLNEFLKNFNGNLERLLIKINAVDLDYRQACTSEETLDLIIDVLFRNGAKEILIGDEPCGLFQEKLKNRNVSLEETLRSFYSGINRNVKFIDLRKFPYIEIEKGFKIREIPYPIINLSLPKAHGQFYYSGLCKNLIGLVPEESRDFFHNAGIFRESKNMKSLMKVIEYFSMIGKPEINILDAYEFLTYHEHFGNLVKTGFAVISDNPVAADIVAIKKLGIGLDKIKYLRDFAKYLFIDTSKIGKTNIYPLKLKKGYEKRKEGIWEVILE